MLSDKDRDFLKGVGTDESRAALDAEAKRLREQVEHAPAGGPPVTLPIDTMFEPDLATKEAHAALGRAGDMAKQAGVIAADVLSRAAQAGSHPQALHAVSAAFRHLNEARRALAIACGNTKAVPDGNLYREY